MTHGFKNGRLIAEQGTIERTGVGEFFSFEDGSDIWQLFSSDGTPEGVIAADIGSLATNITSGELYIKTTDTVNTGWILVGASTGDISNPGGSSTDNAVVRWDGATGTLVQNSNAILSDAGNLTLAVALPVTSGGIGVSSSTDHGILLGSGTSAITTTAAPTNGQFLIGSTGADPVLASLSGGTGISVVDGAGSSTVNLDTPVIVANGGTGLTTITDGGVMLGSGTGAVTPLGQATNGQLVIGSTGVDPVLATLTAGIDISIVNAGGSITISSTAAGGGWVEETGTTRALVINENVVGNNASLITMTLPVTAVFGSKIRIAGLGAGGFLIAQNASQVIHFGNMDTTVGVGGSLATTNRYDCVELLCVVTDNEYVVLSSVGNITIV